MAVPHFMHGKTGVVPISSIRPENEPVRTVPCLICFQVLQLSCT